MDGSNIPSNLFQVREVVTGQHAQHHAQGLGAALVMLASTIPIRRGQSFPQRQIDLTHRSKRVHELGRLALIVVLAGDPLILVRTQNGGIVL